MTSVSNLSSLQKQRIQLILDEDMPASYDSALAASVWNQWQERYSVVFYQSDVDEEFKVVNAQGQELSNGELNKVLTEIIEAIQKSKPRVAHVKSSEKIQSITTTANNPNPASLDKYIKQLDPKVPLSALKSLYNQASQEIEDELKGKSMEEQLAHIHYLRFRADRAQEIYSQNFRTSERKIRVKIDSIRTDSKTKRDKKPPRLKAAEIKVTEKNLTPIQIMMKASKRTDYLDPVAVKMYEARYKEMIGSDLQEDVKYTIETTESETKKFGKGSK